ncbi:Pentatricopeptide repeat-containing protein [Quillaja saponaria]|uniref:Pentatricopeptide repeat-containing protein n=1 Tax=Quillaja saponaria TaxID=32244 RepID=A0AAD7L1D2_QUISA|nr:Pentatricopeptide repeat-containing protein [Quillaja saponaria]
MNMIRQRSNSYHFLFKTRGVVTCTLPVDPPNSTASNVPVDHKTLCFSLAELLIQRGLLSSAQKVVQRMIRHSSLISQALSVVDFAAGHRLGLDLGSYGALIRKLVSSGQPQLAELLYSNEIIARGIDPDPPILNSMVICLCKLGKLEEARNHIDRLLAMNSIPDKVVSNSILREFFSRERFSDAFDYFVRVTDAGAYLDFWCYNMLIDGLCYRGYMDEALQMFDILHKRSKCAPTVHLYKSLFYGLCRRGRLVEAESIFREMESQGLYIDKMMYTSLVSEYCKDKKMKMAMRVFLRMLKTGCKPDNYTCNTLIHGFVKLGLFDKGWIVHNQMIEWGIQPDVVTYHIMITKYCREDKVDCALMLLDSMINCNLAPTAHCYTVLISALYKLNRLNEVDELFISMLERDVVPDHVLFFVLMKNYPKGYELHLAFMILQAIAQKGCGFDLSMISTSHGLPPNWDLEQEIELLLEGILRTNFNLANVAFGVYISALCEEGKINEALVCMDKMIGVGCKPFLFTYNSLIKGLCQEGLFEESKSLIDLMQDHDMVPDQTTYLMMINELCKQGNLMPALDILNQMDQRGLRPTVSIYDSIIGCLFKEKNIFEAEYLFKRMLQSGVDPDEVIYMTMINGYSKNGRAIEALQLFDKMIENSIQPSSHSYTALISGLVNKSMTDEGCIYLDRMIGDGIVPNVVLYTTLLSHFLKKGELGFAFGLFNLMEENLIEGDLVTYITLVSGICRNITSFEKRRCIRRRKTEKKTEVLFQLLHQRTVVPTESYVRVYANSSEERERFALKLIGKIKGVRFMPNLYLYNGIISGFCRAGKMQDAYDHFELMQREGVRPNHVTYTILIDGHIISGNIDSAIVLFNMMNANGCAPDRITYNTLFKGLCMAGRQLDALSLSYAMRKRGFSPNRASYENLLKSFCAEDLGEHAFRIYEEMLAHKYIPC